MRINWASSSDPHVREFAASILADIGGTQAQSYLGRLAQDSNPTVAVNARDDVTRGPYPPDSIDQQAIVNPGGL